MQRSGQGGEGTALTAEESKHVLASRGMLGGQTSLTPAGGVSLAGSLMRTFSLWASLPGETAQAFPH